MFSFVIGYTGAIGYGRLKAWESWGFLYSPLGLELFA
jgi:hypothetical protein